MKLVKNFLWVISIIFITWLIGLSLFINSIPKYLEDTTTKTDAIIVLTGGKSRISEGIKLLSKNLADKLFITGVGQQANLKELLAQSSEIEDVIISPLTDKITLGHMAYDTEGNAIETKEWIEKNNFSSLRLVTSNYHILRSMLEFKLAMPTKIIIANPVFTNNFNSLKWWKSVNSTRLILSEYNKCIIIKIIR